MLWKATATAEKEMQNMKHVWKRYLIVTAMTVVLGLSAGCGSAAEDTNNNQNNTQDENTPDDNENKNNICGNPLIPCPSLCIQFHDRLLSGFLAV